MFNNSISVLSRAAARFKKTVLIVELLIQLMFVGYYTYLLVVHHDDLILLIGYSILTMLGVTIFFVMLFTLEPYQKKVLEFKKYIRRVLRVVSWTGKVIVIGYNIYSLIRFGMTETGQLLLVFSVIIFFTEVILFIISSVLSYYYQLFIYALKMDYQNFIGDKDIAEKPIGRVLLNMNDETDYEDEVNALFIEQEIYEEVKKYSEKEDSPVINRRKIEKQIFSYYKDTQFYYLDNDRLEEICNYINNNIDTEGPEFAHLRVLKFFLINGIEKVYYGLTDQYFRFVLSGLIIYMNNKSLPVVEIIYQIIIKHLVGNTDWSKPLGPTSSPKKSFFSFFKGKETNSSSSISATMFPEVSGIIKKSVEEKEKELKKTVGGEIEGIVSTTIKKKVSGSIKSKIKGIFKKKK